MLNLCLQLKFTNSVLKYVITFGRINFITRKCLTLYLTLSWNEMSVNIVNDYSSTSPIGLFS